MPTMPRTSNKATKIAYKILGVPLNMEKQTRVYRKINKRLQFENSRRVR